MFEVVIKRTLPSQISDSVLLYDAHPFVGDAVGHVGVVVHAVSHEAALRRQRELLDEPLRRHHALLQAAVLLHLEGEQFHGRAGPAVRRVSLVDVDQQEIRHVREVLHQPPEDRQLVHERGSAGRAEVDHQRPVGGFEVQQAALVRRLSVLAAPLAARDPGNLHHFGVGCHLAQFHLQAQRKIYTNPDADLDS